MRPLTPTLLCVLLAAPTACGDSRDTTTLEVTAGDACGDAFFWATTESGDLAVTVRIEAMHRSTTEETTWEFEVSDPDVAVEILEGEGLSANFCNDVVSTSAEPRQRQAGVAGEGTITLQPALAGPDPLGCGSVVGELELTGLQAADGTRFGPVRVTSDSIGCYSG